MMLALPGYHLNANLYEGYRTRVYRGTRIADDRPVVIKLQRSEYPSYSELLQYRNQYTIAKNLDIPGIIKPLALEPYGNGYALIMPDGGYISLKEWRRGAFSIGEFLSIAIQLAKILHGLSQHRVIHKDIKPANILIHPHSQEIKLIDFSIASLLPKEIQTTQNPNELEGTLAYLAPEQTGRMNRGIDYRTDFYGLGVTLYKLLTGQLPFSSDDPRELIHCHIAKLPVPPHVIDKTIPPTLSKIVVKLMAKNAEDRYQSAIGLQWDWERCLTAWNETGTIAEFELAQHDTIDRFLIPEKLYGREAEVQTLLDAFDRVSAGNTEFMLVAGFSGIGKTAVVREVHKPIVRQHGYFIQGKFDQFNRNIPFFAFVQAFRDLMGQLLSESDTRLQAWKTKILEALGDSGQIIIDVIPELERILGQQPPVPELSGTAAQNRFNLLFQKFIQVFAQAEHPLTLFLDDLQWADSGSLHLIKQLMSVSEIGYLFLIGAYRDNEVFAGHPLMLEIEEIAKTGATVNTLTLKPLSQKSLNDLVADTLNCPQPLALPLTKLVYQKTQGNPFFATQLIKVLYQDRLIDFNADAGHWQCDIVRVRESILTDDIVEFMTVQLQKLSDITQEILTLAACIGNQFDLATLAIVSEKPEADVSTLLWQVLQEGLILPQSEVYKFYSGDRGGDESLRLNESLPLILTKSQVPTYKFLHDRIQQAAYALLPDEQKVSVHLSIGRLLLSHIDAEERHHRLFEIVNHLNFGFKSIDDTVEKQKLLHLNILAGRQAQSATAYIPALEYFSIGLNLLGDDSWQTNYELTKEIYLDAANAAYLSGNLSQVQTLLDTAFSHAKTLLDKVPYYEIQIQAWVAQHRQQEAIQLGLAVLQDVNIDFPKQPTPEDFKTGLQNIHADLAGRPISELILLPKMESPVGLAAMRILVRLSAVVVMASPHLMPFIFFEMVRLSIQQGNIALSALGYATYGIILCSTVGEIDIGYQYGKLAFQILEKFSGKEVQAKTIARLNGGVWHWKESLRSTLPALVDNYHVALETGDLEYAAISAQVYASHIYFCGQDLTQVDRELAAYSQALAPLYHQEFLYCVKAYHQHVLNLLGQSTNPIDLMGEAYNESVDLPTQYAEKDSHGIAVSHLIKGIGCYLFNVYTEALDNLERVRPFLRSIVPFTTGCAWAWYDSLTRCALLPRLTEEEQIVELEKIAANQQKLKLWASHAPMNYLHRFHLVEAERYAALGDNYKAIEFYDLAIAGAEENDYIQEAAIANERAGQFYIDWGKENVAAGYIQEAYYGYAKWGAKAKADELENRYPSLLRPILLQSAYSLNPLEMLETLAFTNLSVRTATVPSYSSKSGLNNALDFAAILKASQAIAGTITLENLLHKITQIILQHSGADYCALILQNSEGKWQVRAISTPETTEEYADFLEDNTNVPVKLIQYVKNTREVAIFDNLQTDLPVLDDYLIQQQPKSVLCLPVLSQGQLIGILYLKNQKTCGVFTKERLTILNFLCTQAAISLENSQFYQREQEKLQQLQEKNNLLAFQSTISHIATCHDRLSVMLGEFCQEIVNYLDVALARIWVLNSEQNILELKASAGLYTHLNGAHQFIPVGKFKIGTIAREKKPNLSNDVLNDESISNRQWAEQQGMVAFAGYPLMLGEEVIGVVAMFSQKVFSPSTLDSLQFVAAEISLGIDRNLLASSLARKATCLEKALEDLQKAQLQIVQSEKMSALGNLVAGVAHEINNPVSFIGGNLQPAEDYIRDLFGLLDLYQEKYPEPDADIEDEIDAIDLDYIRDDLPKLLASMKLGVERIGKISTSLRTFSRTDKEYKVPFNLHEGLESTILILKHRLKASEKRPEIEIVKKYGDFPEVLCFPGQINQVFMNLIANAIDALEESNEGRSFAEICANPNRITLQTETIDDRVFVRVRDNGQGIPEVVQDKIFEQGFTTKGVGKGTGLGLAIVRQIILEKHGGKLTVFSTPGEGTEFTIVLDL